MKLINQERILRAIANVDSLLDKYETEIKVVQELSLIGLNSLVQRQDEMLTVRQDFAQKMTALGIDPEINNLQNIQKRLFYQALRLGSKRTKIEGIQRKYNVSGLVEFTTQLGDKNISYLWCHEDLVLVNSDLPRLRACKTRLFGEWLEYTQKYNYPIYCRKEGEKQWSCTTLAYISAALPFYDWGILYEADRFLSPSRLKNNGFDEARKQKTFEDDCRYHDVCIELGIGLFPNSPKAKRITFCASNAGLIA